MASEFLTDLGKLLLRTVLGILILLHGIAKLQTGVAAIGTSLANAGVPAAVAYLVYLGEVVAPVLLVLGLWTRPAALVVAINMLVATLLSHSSQIFSLSRSGGWAIELQAMYLFTALAVALVGAGRFSVAGRQGRWN
jgi:putative oxidoreductase